MSIVKRIFCLFGVIFGLISPLAAGSKLFAADNGNGFSLQVTPSPLVLTIDPGKKTTQELKVRNNNTVAETLKMELKSFSVDKISGKISFGENSPEFVKDFVSFSEPVFNIDAGQWFTQKITIDTPKDSGFSYSFAIMISRDKSQPIKEGVSNIEGSIAVFTLFNVNRPDATKKLSISSFSTEKRMYEYLPTSFNLVIENTGNSIVQPKGNIFIGRGADEAEPLAAIQVNPGGGYVLPGVSRSLNVKWNDGFPSVDDKGNRTWDWSILSHLRIGRYTAKVLVIYDDGQRDSVMEATITFWIMPWKIIIGLILILVLLTVGLITIAKKGLNLKKSTAKSGNKDDAKNL